MADELVARFKARTKRHRRSLNNETIAALELADATAIGTTSLPAALHVDLGATLRRMEEIRAGLRSKAVAEGREDSASAPAPPSDAGADRGATAAVRCAAQWLQETTAHKRRDHRSNRAGKLSTR